MDEEHKPKRADQRSSLTILVLGDDGVGKSSLISTFVSRYFSESVPGIMTRVRLPPDPHTSCVTTIVDSQEGDAALVAALAAQDDETGESLPAATAIPSIDSVVLVYDLDRVDTFFRLENHWLPLIERCYDGKIPVVVAENKMDLFRPSSVNDEQALTRKRQQIVALMQRFPFVRQCVKCSAKNLLRVDDIFIKAQQAVLYPFTPPLYDLENGMLTDECKRALTRIFRVYDVDRDGLLSDDEIYAFQTESFRVPVMDRDLAAWKKVVQRHNPTDEPVVQDGKFTHEGFFNIFDVFVSQNRLDVVWQALRHFGYDDDLHLHVPDHVTTPVEEELQDWRLTPGAKQFLSEIFHQFDADKDGILSVEDLVSIFSVLPPPALPPWHPIRAASLFKTGFARPKDPPVDSMEAAPDTSYSDSLIVPPAMSQTLGALSMFSSIDSLPSVELGGYPVSKPLSYLEWMNLWYVVAAISPAVARAELFRLGFVERRESPQDRTRPRRRKLVSPVSLPADASLPSREVRVLVLGSHASGKTALLNALCGQATTAAETISTSKPETSGSFVKLDRGDGSELVVHFVFTDVPETAAASQKEHYRQLSELFGLVASPKDRICDLAMLVFDCTKRSSLMYAKELEEKLLTKETPRVFVATKSDLHMPPEVDDGDAQPSTVLDVASIHTRESELESPFLTSVKSPGLSEESIKEALLYFARCALDEPGVQRLRCRPYEERQRREAARRRKLVLLGSIVGVGVAVAVGMGLLWSGKGGHHKGQSRLGWLRSWFARDVRQATACSQ